MLAAQVRWDDHRTDDTLGMRQGGSKLNREDRASLGVLLRDMYTALQDEPPSPRLKAVLDRLAQSQSE